MTSRKSKQQGLRKSNEFSQVISSIEDEILEIYGEITEESQDFYLTRLPEFFQMLKIPDCFVRDINQCVEYYYEYMNNKEIEIQSSNLKQFTTLQLIKSFTITNSINDLNNIIDIIDIDKLIKNVNKLIKFRNSYKHIYESWKLFIDCATDSKDQSEHFIINYKLSLPDLKKIKTSLNLDHERNSGYSLSDLFLIDMLGCCSTSPDGDQISFDFNKPKNGSCITIKEFAEILGNLGELD